MSYVKRVRWERKTTGRRRREAQMRIKDKGSGYRHAAGWNFGEGGTLNKTARQAAPALDWSNWNVLSVTSPISIFRQAETLAVHIWKVNSEGTIPD